MDNTVIKKRKFRFNVIDAVLLFIIVAAAALLAYIFISGNLDNFVGEESKHIEYTVLFTGVRDEFKGDISIGDKVTDTVKLMPIGEVVDIKYEDTISVIEDKENGSLVYSVFPDFTDIAITVKADALIKNNYYMIGGYQISVGTLVSLRVPDFISQGYCTAISEVSE